MREVQTKIEHLTLAQVIKRSQIYFDPDINQTRLGQIDQDMIDLYNITNQTMNNKKFSPWVLRMELNTESLSGHRISIEDIAQQI